MKYNILIVDDSKIIRLVLNKILIMLELDPSGFVEARNGCEALQMISENKIDLVIADINMPEMNGIELIKQMRSQQDSAKIPVIFLSSHVSENLKQQLKDYSVAAFVSKPFTPEKIRDVLSSIFKLTE